MSHLLLLFNDHDEMEQPMVSRSDNHSTEAALADSSTTESTRVVVEEYVTAWTAADTSGLAALLADDVVWQTPHSIGVERRGREAVAAQLAGGAASQFVKVETLSRTVRYIIVDDSHAVVLVRLSATAHSGAEYINEYAWHYEVVDGRIQRIEEYADTLKAARLGFLPFTEQE